MKKTMKLFCLLSFLTIGAIAAPAPYPVVINSQSPSAPSLDAFRANMRTFRVQFYDGGTVANLSGHTTNDCFMSWSTSATSSTRVAASAQIYNATNGQVDFTFAVSNLNYAQGRYIYEVGVSNSVVRQGVFIINGSPFGAGAQPISFATSVNWNAISWVNLPSYITDAPADANTYGRKSNAWVTVSGGVGSGTFTNVTVGTNVMTAQAIIQGGSNITTRAAGGTNYFDGATFSSLFTLQNGGGLAISQASGPTAILTVSNSPNLGGLPAANYATGTPLYVQSETNASARLASNVWAAADSTTNYARRVEAMTNNSFSINGVPVGTGSNVTISGGSGSGADTNSVGLIATNAVNQSTNVSARLATTVWNSATGDFVTASWGIHSLNGVYEVTNARGGQAAALQVFWTNGALDLVKMSSGSIDGPVLKFARGFGSDGQDHYGEIGIPQGDVLYVSTGEVYRIEDTKLRGTPGYWKLLDTGNFPYKTLLVADGRDLTNIPLTALRVTNTPSAGQVLATSNGTNGYWTTVSGGSGSITGVSTTVSGLGTTTNSSVVTITGSVTAVSASPWVDTWEVANTISTQIIAGSSFSNINFDTYAPENSGRSYNITNDVLIFSSTGLCHVTAAARVFGMSSTARAQMALYKNGSLYRQGIVISAATNATPTISVSFFNTAATNQYNVWVQHEDATARTLTGAGASSGYFIWASGYRFRNAGE